MTPSQNDTWAGTMGEALALTSKDPDCWAVPSDAPHEGGANRKRIDGLQQCEVFTSGCGLRSIWITAQALLRKANIYRLKPTVGEVRNMRAWELATYLAEHGGELMSYSAHYRVDDGQLQFRWPRETSWKKALVEINSPLEVTIPGEPKWVALTIAEVEELRNA